jgi:uncharacterized OsmC-like protein
VEVDIYLIDEVKRVRRIINSDNRSSKWTLNGNHATQSEVKSFIASCCIDVDNLCSFMPQDKVGNFTRFSPREVLENTLKAITVDESGRTLQDEQRDLATIEATKINHRRELNSKKATLDARRVELRGLEAERERMMQRMEDKVGPCRACLTRAWL